MQRVVYVVPAGAVWSLPAYELALMTGSWLLARGIDGVTVALVTPEDEPLHLFGRDASEAVRALLDERGIAVHTRAYPAEANPASFSSFPTGSWPPTASSRFRACRARRSEASRRRSKASSRSTRTAG